MGRHLQGGELMVEVNGKGFHHHDAEHGDGEQARDPGDPRYLIPEAAPACA